MCAITIRGERRGGRRRWHHPSIDARLYRRRTEFISKPDAPFGLVDSHFQQARRRDVAVFVAGSVRLAHGIHQAGVVLAQLRQHVEGRHVSGVVVGEALQSCDVADRPAIADCTLSEVERQYSKRNRRVASRA